MGFWEKIKATCGKRPLRSAVAGETCRNGCSFQGIEHFRRGGGGQRTVPKIVRVPRHDALGARLHAAGGDVLVLEVRVVWRL